MAATFVVLARVVTYRWPARYCVQADSPAPRGGDQNRCGSRPVLGNVVTCHGRLRVGMGDADDSPRERARAELLKDRVMARLRTLAAWAMHSSQDAEDLLQSALARVFDPQGSPWDPNGKKTFVLHVGAVMNNLASNERQSFHARHVVVDSTLARDDNAIDGAPLADEALHEQRKLAHRRKLGSELLAELDKTDPTAAAVYRAICKGAEGHAEIAAEVGCKEEEVRLAYDRIKYHARQILERDRRAQLEEMGERRQKSMKASSKGSSGPRGTNEQA